MYDQPLSAEMRWAGPIGFLIFTRDDVEVASVGVVRSPSGVTVNALTVKSEEQGGLNGYWAFQLTCDVFMDYLSDPVEFEWVNNTLVCGNLSVVASKKFKPAVDRWALKARERINADSRLLQGRSRTPVEEREAFSGKKVASLARKDPGKDRKA